MVLTVPDPATYEPQVKAVGWQILTAVGEQHPLLLQPDWWQTQVLELAGRDPEFKRQLLRFVDVFPALHTVDQISSHLQQYFENPSGELPLVLRLGIKAAWPGQITTGLVARTLERNLQLVGESLIPGRDVNGVLPALRRLRRENTAFLLHLLGETVETEAAGAAAVDSYLQAIPPLLKETGSWPPAPQVDEAPWGPAPRVCLSVKPSALAPHLDPLDFERTRARLAAALRPLFRAARDARLGLMLDMERFPTRDLTLAVFQQLVLEHEFASYPYFGVTLQAYLLDAEEDAQELIALAAQRGAPLLVRLGKGAYWEEETKTARQNGWPLPVLQHKADTDVQFERLARLFVEHSETIRLSVATHNARSAAAAAAAAAAAGLAQGHLEFQVLYGMSDPLRKALVQLGHRVREYVPVGPLPSGMPYLGRRIVESTSSESFLRKLSSAKSNPEELLARPLPTPDLRQLPLERIDVYATDPRAPGAFRNEPPLDFSREINRLDMQQALEAVAARSSAHHPLLIGGLEVETSRTITSVNPADPSRILGTVAAAGAGEAERAVQAARHAAADWRRTPAEERAAVLFRAADLLRRERCLLAALEILEAGKPWRDADADVAEAIDYLEYYGRESLRLAEPRRLGETPGETNLYFYEPRGIAAVIAPWNFPLAILCGMTAAALVAGNTVIMKPAAPTPLVAWELHRLLLEAGLPPSALSYLPGPGPEVGPYLATHPDVDLVAFTGSKEVGLSLLEAAAQVRLGQSNVRRVIAEMGGKNAIIVDEDADLTLAVQGILASAFGYSGQKCSACSRLIVLQSIHDELVDRLCAAAAELAVGDPAQPAISMGPLITAEAVAKASGYVEAAAQEARLAFAGSVPDGSGYYMAPHIFTNVDRHAALAQEEIFAPVLAVLAARDFAEAIALALDVPYGLTGGLYSRSPAHVAAAERDFHVGNLYINRPITGALVDRQPFGGSRMSGVGSKAGGPDYLLQFMEPRTVTRAE